MIVWLPIKSDLTWSHFIVKGYAWIEPSAWPLLGVLLFFKQIIGVSLINFSNFFETDISFNKEGKMFKLLQWSVYINQSLNFLWSNMFTLRHRCLFILLMNFFSVMNTGNWLAVNETISLYQQNESISSFSVLYSFTPPGNCSLVEILLSFSLFCDTFDILLHFNYCFTRLLMKLQDYLLTSPWLNNLEQYTHVWYFFVSEYVLLRWVFLKLRCMSRIFKS